MKRSHFIKILNAIKLVSNNVSTVENFNNKALMRFKMAAVRGESPKQQKTFQKLLVYSSCYSIVAENYELVITVKFDLE